MFKGGLVFSLFLRQFPIFMLVCCAFVKRLRVFGIDKRLKVKRYSFIFLSSEVINDAVLSRLRWAKQLSASC